MTNYSNTIENVLAGFDFQKVYAYVRMVGWVYHDSPDTPTIKTLEATARYLLESVAKNQSWAETGGFRAELTGGEDEPEELNLKFIMTTHSEYV